MNRLVKQRSCTLGAREGAGLKRKHRRVFLSRVGGLGLVAALFLLGTGPMQTAASAAPGDLGTISGTVWEDRNADGIRDHFDSALSGVKVYAVNDAGDVSPTVTTGTNGTYELRLPESDARWRVHAEPEPGKGWQDGYLSIDGSQQSASDVRFAKNGDVTVDFSFQKADRYGESNPYVYVPVRQMGNYPVGQHGPTTRGGGIQPWNADGFYEKDQGSWVVPFSQVGTTWGSAWVKPQEASELGSLYVSAALAGYSSFGPQGIGAIYRITPDGANPTMDTPTASATLLVDLTQKGVNLGNRVGAVIPTPSTGKEVPQSDPGAAEPNVGKAGLGGMVASADGTKLYAVNVYERKLIEMTFDGPDSVSSVVQHTLPGGSVPNVRPWGITIDPKNGDVLVSGTSETTKSVVIWRAPKDALQNASIVAQGTHNGVVPWTNVSNESPPANFLATNLEFMSDGRLLVNLLSRGQLQFAYQIDGWGHGSYSAARGAIGIMTRSGETNFNNLTWVQNTWHEDGYDASIGSTTINPLLKESLTTTLGLMRSKLDPSQPERKETDINSVVRFDENWKWQQTRSINTDKYDPTWRLGKAAGLGDLSQLTGVAPIEIGNRVWFDANNDGIQDPTEIPVGGVRVTLLTAAGEPVLGANGEPITTVTDEHGVWKFRSDEVPLKIRTDYRVKFDATDLPEKTLEKLRQVGVTNPKDMRWTKQEVGETRVDSNPDPATGITNIFTTGNAGENDHTIDAGLWVPALSFDKTSDPESGTLVMPGSQITYTVSITNSQKAAQPEGSVIDDLSDVLDKTTMSSDQGPKLTCELLDGDVPANANCGEIKFDQSAETITWKASNAHPIDGETTARITYTVTVNEDALGAVGNVLVDTDISTKHPVFLSGKDSDPESGSIVAPGDEITYTIWFENSGDVEATSFLNSDGESVPLELRDDLSAVINKATLLPDAKSPDIIVTTAAAGASCEDATGPSAGQVNWDADSATIVWSSDTLAADTRVCVSYAVQVNTDNPDTVEDETPVGTLKNVFLDHSTEHTLPVSLAWNKVDAEEHLLAGSEWMLRPILTDDEGNAVLDEQGSPIVDTARDTIEHIDDCLAENPTCNGVDVDPEKGRFRVDGLLPGLYELTETKAPAGFIKLSAPVFINVSDDIAVTVHGDIVNNQQVVPVLPLTGGIGSDYLLIAGGITAMLLLILVMRNEFARRRSAEVFLS